MIELNNRIIRAWIDAAGLAAPELGKLHLLGIRGAIPVGPRQITRVEQQPDHYDDSIICYGTELEAFRGSCDPGVFFTKKPLNPGGCAHICDGGPYHPYRLGKHKGHNAVVEVGPIRYWRDRNKDGKQGSAENPQTGVIAANIHAGGLEIVGKNSAGCLVVQGGWDGVPWKKFLLYCTKAAPQQDGAFKLWILDGKTLDPTIGTSPRGTTYASVREGTAA